MLLISSTLFATSAQNTSSNSWPNFRHDSAHSGTSDSNAPNTNQTLWVFDAGVYVVASPTVSNGVVYACTDGYVYAIDASTGRQIWNYSATGLFRSSATREGDTVYVNCNDGNLVALNAATGQKKWSYTTGESGWYLSSPAVSNGKVYFGSYDGVVYALDAASGAKVWNFSVERLPSHTSRVWSSPAVVGNVVYVGSGYNVGQSVYSNPPGIGNVYALDATTGAKIWNYSIGDCVDSSPAVVNGVLYVGSWDNHLYALNAANGNFMWRTNLGGRVDASPAVNGNTVYISSFDKNIYALNAQTGAKIWNFSTGDIVDSSPSVAGGVVYVGSADHYIYALNAATGAKIFSYQTPWPVESSAAIANGVVYIGANDNKLYAFGTMASPNPTGGATPTPTATTPQTPTPTVEPSPTVPELSSLIAVCMLTFVAMAVLAIKKRNLTGKRN